MKVLKKVTLTFCLMFAFCIALFFGGTKYVKNRIEENFSRLSNKICQVTYKNISFYSLSFPLKYKFSVNNPSVSCVIYDAFNSERKSISLDSDYLLLSFDILGDLFVLDVPNKVLGNKGSDTEISCSGFGKLTLVLLDNLYNSKSGKIKSILYKGDEISCNAVNGVTSTGNAFFDLSIIYPDGLFRGFSVLGGSNITVLSGDNERILKNSINLLLERSKGGGHSIDVMDFLLDFGDSTISLVGKLDNIQNIFGLSGRIVLDIHNYERILEGMFGQDKNQYNEMLKKISNYANFIDGEKLVIVLQNIGDEFYVGRKPINDAIIDYQQYLTQNKE